MFKEKHNIFNLGDLNNTLPISADGINEPKANNEENIDKDSGITDTDLDVELNLLLEKKRKKKKKINLLVGAPTEPFAGDTDKKNQASGTLESDQPAWVNTDRDYTYDELLELAFGTIKEKNPEISDKYKKPVIRIPQLLKVGANKSSFVNFICICKSLHRQPKHVQTFLLTELGTSGSMNANNQLIMKGIFKQNQIENILKVYIKDYVSCQSCRSMETILQKDNRIYLVHCQTCGSKRAPPKTKSGFQAVIGKRTKKLD